MSIRSTSITIGLILVAGLYYIFQSPAIFTGASENAIPCQEPLTYYIGSIDPRFDIGERELKNRMKKVETIWEKPLDQELLEYTPGGQMPINLIYSEEQQRTQSGKQLSQRIQNTEQQISALKQEYNRLSKNFKSQKKEHQNLLSTYRKKVREYKQSIQKWNARGGVPQGEQKDIQQKQQQITQLETDLRRRQQNIKYLRKRVNTKSEQLNKLIERQQSLVEKYNRQFAQTGKFNQGRYIRKGGKREINIYQFGNRAELTLVLAHEVGHSLGLTHLDNPKSVMYKLMKEQDIFNLSLSTEDISAIQKQCGH